MQKDFVVEAFIINDSKIVLIKHKKLGMWLPPGGHILKDETPDEAVLREVREETGLEVKIISPNKRFEDMRVVQLSSPHHVQLENIEENHQHVDFVYMCEVQNSHAEEGEDQIWKWFSLHEIDENPEVPENVKFFSKMILDGP